MKPPLTVVRTPLATYGISCFPATKHLHPLLSVIMLTAKLILSKWYDKLLSSLLTLLYLPAYSKETNPDDQAPLKVVTIIAATLLKTPFSFLTLYLVMKQFHISSLLPIFLVACLSFGFWEWMAHSVLQLNKQILSELHRLGIRNSSQNLMIKMPIFGYILTFLSFVVSIGWLMVFMFYSALVIFDKSW